MHKLVILIESVEDPVFDENWPDFLHLAERMPGLRRETTARVDGVLFGERDYALIHELYFDSAAALHTAMASPVGQAAGRLLQAMTGGKLALLYADHKEDELENIRKYSEKREEAAGETPLSSGQAGDRPQGDDDQAAGDEG